LPPDGWRNPNVVPTLSAETNSWYVLLPREINLPDYYRMAWRTNASVEGGNTIWLCPRNPRRSNGTNLFHYCLNEEVNGTGKASKPMHLSTIRRPTAVVWLFDSKNLPPIGAGNFVHTNLHGRGAQFLFLDGHGERFDVAAYRAADGSLITNNPDLVWCP